MKACNVKKTDTFLVSRIPSWKLFSRLEYLCIKRAILGKMPLKALQAFRRRLGNQLPRLDKRRVPKTWPERHSSSFHSRQLIHFPTATESRPGSQDHQKLLPKGWLKQTRSQQNESLKKSLELPRTYACRPKLKVMDVVQSFNILFFCRWTSSYFFQHF